MAPAAQPGRVGAGAAVLVASAAWCLRDLARHAGPYLDGDSSFVVARGALSAAALVAAAWLWSRRERLRLDAAVLRGLGQTLLWGLAAGTLAAALAAPEHVRWSTRSAFFVGWMGALLAWALRLGRARTPRGGRAARALDALATNALVTLLLLEASIVAWVRVHPTPLVAPPTVDARLEAMRQPPHALHYGERLNAGGYADDEFFVAGDDDLVAVFLADSFGLAVVPPSLNFVSVAESRVRDVLDDRGRRAGRVGFHDFGVPAIGPAEYAQLWLDEAAATRPSIVVLCVFLGNDVEDGPRFVSAGSGAERYGLQGWLATRALRRSARLLRTSRGERDAVAGLAAAEPAAALPHLGDASLEAPTFTEARYLEIESDRVELTRRGGRVDRQLPDFLRALDWFHDALDERLLVVLIPDEYHVNDALWAELMARRADPDAFDRFSVQARVLAHCRERGIDCLDLTPALRAAEPAGRTYHLRDTHWNARGNRVAGEAIARAIVERLD